MTIIPLIAASLFAPTPIDTNTSPAWMSSQPLLAADALLDPRVIPEQHDSDNNHAQDSWYLRATGGFVTTESSDGPDEEIDFDEGYLLSLGIGHRFGASETGVGFALELEGVWTDQDADDDGALQAVTDVTVAGALLNGMVDFRFADHFSIYGGAGIGAAWLDIGTASDGIDDFDDEDGPFLAWQARAGLAWSFTESLSLHVGYRFLNVDDAELDNGAGDSSFDLETQQHVLEAGLLFGF